MAIVLTIKINVYTEILCATSPVLRAHSYQTQIEKQINSETVRGKKRREV